MTAAATGPPTRPPRSHGRRGPRTAPRTVLQTTEQSAEGTPEEVVGHGRGIEPTVLDEAPGQGVGHPVPISLGCGRNGVHQGRQALGQQLLTPALHGLPQQEVVDADHGREQDGEADGKGR